tara:strand:+ start:248 stop:439 length:192 start_codon:yes stop_codon:yes gene_type:complete
VAYIETRLLKDGTYEIIEGKTAAYIYPRGFADEICESYKVNGVPLGYNKFNLLELFRRYFVYK